MDTVKIQETKPTPDSIARIAINHGLPSNTVHVRLRRGKTWEQALMPIGSYPKKQSLDHEGYERVKEYIIAYKHANSGYPPPITHVEEAMGFKSSGKARIVLENLQAQGFLRLMDQSKIGVIDERWLAPDENQLLQQLITLAIVSDDPAVREAATRLDAELSNIAEVNLSYRPFVRRTSMKGRFMSRGDLKMTKEFIIKFKRDNGGLSPSLKRMVELMDLSSIIRARVLIENLERKEFLRVTTDTGRLILPGEDWLAPEENKLLNRLIIAALASGDKKLFDLADALEIEDGKPGINFLDPLRAAAFAQLVALVGQDGAAYRQISIIESGDATKNEKRQALAALLDLYRESDNDQITNLIYWLEPERA